MNMKEYTKSGIIEDYCLGLLNPDEMRSVAKNALYYKEIKTAIEEFELTLKRYAEDWAVHDETGKRKNDFPGENISQEGS
jgi:hypothetical protein